ncbi:P-loop containing nucleoside triphosphate hydrolase protein [Thamnidium elegans]|nr:P-loop containing nucleoside triphosphate hydrolase protein [Thamnidium elegans]
MHIPKVVTIGISGPSCSGKTTLALLLKKLLNKVIVINQDEFFKQDDQIPVDESTGLANWDSPSAVDFQGLNCAIDSARKDPFKLLSQKKKVLQNNHDGSDNLNRVDFKHIWKQLESLEDIIFVIVEGFLLFCDADVCANLDNKFFVTASREVLKERRESRPGYQTLQGYWVDPPGYFDQIVYPQYLLWNGHLLDPNTRDPSIRVLSTDTICPIEIITTVISSLQQQYI